MVLPTRMAVNLFAMAKCAWCGKAPKWARRMHQEMLDEIASLHRKVNSLMALDSTLAAKLTAIVAGLIPAVQAVITSNQAKDQTIADLRGQLTAEQQAEVAEDAQEALDTAPLEEALGTLKTLVEGPSTPDVTPVPVEDVPGVVDGSTPVTDTSGDPVVSDPAGSTE